MKYTVEVIIDLPRDKVIELFDSTENMYNWQPTLKSHKQLSGDPGKKDAKMKLVYNERGKDMEMIETIIEQNLPEKMVTAYEAKGVYNVNINNFVEEADKTRWIMEADFKFKGFMRVMAFFMRGAFPKSTLASMNMFKDFAEKEPK